MLSFDGVVQGGTRGTGKVRRSSTRHGNAELVRDTGVTSHLSASVGAATYLLCRQLERQQQGNILATTGTGRSRSLGKADPASASKTAGLPHPWLVGLC